jgi:predicted O-methyltransferase YrrM
MAEMTNDRWEHTNDYLREVFGEQDQILTDLTSAAAVAGLPGIGVTPDVGRLLMILTAMTEGRLVLELGTLGGYSAIWMARAMAADGRLITIEFNDLHADFAEEQFAKAGLTDRIEVRRGAALDVLPVVADELGPESVDVAFVDAVKSEYPDYFRLVKPLIAPGGLFIADNVFGSGAAWIDESDHHLIQGPDQLNRLVAADPDFEAVAVPIRSGVLVGRRNR